MNRTTRKRLMMGGIALVVLLGLVWAFIPKPVPVRTAVVQRAPLQQVVEQEGKTEVVDRYAISAPVAAYLHRIELEAGDPVTRGQPVVRLEPPRSAILVGNDSVSDLRSRHLDDVWNQLRGRLISDNQTLAEAADFGQHVGERDFHGHVRV